MKHFILRLSELYLIAAFSGITKTGSREVFRLCYMKTMLVARCKLYAQFACCLVFTVFFGLFSMLFYLVLAVCKTGCDPDHGYCNDPGECRWLFFLFRFSRCSFISIFNVDLHNAKVLNVSTCTGNFNWSKTVRGLNPKMSTCKSNTVTI